jgi:hypothetical protein
VGISSRGGAVVARRAHNPKVVGSNPTPATKIKRALSLCAEGFFFYSNKLIIDKKNPMV